MDNGPAHIAFKRNGQYLIHLFDICNQLKNIKYLDWIINKYFDIENNTYDNNLKITQKDEDIIKSITLKGQKLIYCLVQLKLAVELRDYRAELNAISYVVNYDDDNQRVVYIIYIKIQKNL